MTYPTHPPYSAPPAAPAPPRRREWWVGIAFGCGAIGFSFLVLTIGAGLLGVVATQGAKSIRPQSRAETQKSLGSIPLYPNGKLDPKQAQVMLGTTRTLGKLFGSAMGNLIKGAAAQTTEDSPEKIWQFYDSHLGSAGWQLAQTRDAGFQQSRQYRRGAEVCIIQTQSLAGRTTIIIMRGSAALGGGSTSKPLPYPQSDPSGSAPRRGLDVRP